MSNMSVMMDSFEFWYLDRYDSKGYFIPNLVEYKAIEVKKM